MIGCPTIFSGAQGAVQPQPLAFSSGFCVGIVFSSCKFFILNPYFVFEFAVYVYKHGDLKMLTVDRRFWQLVQCRCVINELVRAIMSNPSGLLTTEWLISRLFAG